MSPIPRLIAAALACAAHLSAPAAPPPNLFIDTAHFDIDAGGLNMGVGGMDEWQHAQTLTVQKGGVAVGAYLPVSCFFTGSLVVRLLDVDAAGYPGGNTLAGARIPVAQLPLSFFGYFVYIPFKSEVAVAAGDRLALAASAPAGDCIWNLSPFSTDYPHGTNFYRNRYITSWTPSPPTVLGNDYPFQLVMRP